MSPRLLPVFVVDAFAGEPFSGNPAAVCLPSAPLEPELMQRVAAEMNLSETSFPSPPGTGDGPMRELRWFTPTREVSLCGHATLAAAHVLLTEDQVATRGPLGFRTLSGVLTVHPEEDGRLRLDFPIDPPEAGTPPEGLLDALGVPADTPAFRGRRAWLLRLGSAEEVAALAPDQGRLGSVPVGDDILGVTITSPAADDDDAHFVSRFFAPWVGVPEDPVTGMAHTLLAPYWAGELGLSELRGRQISRRGGEVGVRVRGDRVDLLGRAVTVLEGSLRLP